MCRVIGFVGAVGGIGVTSLAIEFARFLSKRKYKTCLFDGCFNNNSICWHFNGGEFVDFKEYVFDESKFENVLNKRNDYLSFVKTNSSSFNYMKEMKTIERFFKVCENEFDFVIVDCGVRVGYFSKIVGEMIVVSNDNKEGLLKTYRLVKKINLSDNVCNLKVVLNKSCFALQFSGKRITKNDYEKILNVDVLCEIPKFVWRNCFDYKNITNKNKIYIKKFCNALITNKCDEANHLKKFKGVFGFLRRKWNEQFE